jgi:hypothetical protein
VIGISEAYAAARSFTENPSAEVQRDFGATTEDFVRKNEKYFVKPEGNFLIFFYIDKFSDFSYRRSTCKVNYSTTLTFRYC